MYRQHSRFRRLALSPVHIWREFTPTVDKPFHSHWPCVIGAHVWVTVKRLLALQSVEKPRRSALGGSKIRIPSNASLANIQVAAICVRPIYVEK